MTDKTEKITFTSSTQWLTNMDSDVSFLKNMQNLHCVAFARFYNGQTQIKIGLSWDTLKFEKLTGTFSWFHQSNGYCDKETKYCVDLYVPGLTKQCIKISNCRGAVDLRYSFDLTLHRISADGQVASENERTSSDNMPQGIHTNGQLITHKRVAFSESPTPQGTPANCQVVPEIKNYDLATEISYDKMSNQHDAVLLIEDKKLHVNRALLSYHSTYFRDLFAEKADEENGIRIEDVTYENFGLLMRAIYPETAFVNDQNAETLLHLGNRFKIPSVMRHVENQLMNSTKLTNGRLIVLADKYDLRKLLENAKFSDYLITLLNG